MARIRSPVLEIALLELEGGKRRRAEDTRRGDDGGETRNGRK